ncbi:hypothetical protein HNQ44_002575 [Planomicrobium koreense]|uniref:Uncharacterized protein n=1 Tax=Planococcus koreensis TaxID=112331 RepID=A0A7W8CT31_9BACL|nr:hypothetical protein [Planococcus koreensis]MBB5181110.1 hypothetical protein [Planococcus koreensis]
MKQIFLYVATMLGGGLLTYIGERWFGAEWLFGLLTVALFGLFLEGWKCWGTSGGGLVIVTAFLLLTLDSIFFVQYWAVFICSLLMAVLLMPHYRKHRDGVAASVIFVGLNMLSALEFIPSELMLWLIVLATGAGSLIGFRFKFPLVKASFAALFSISAFFLLFFQLFDGSPLLTVLAFLTVAIFIVSMYRLNRSATA